MYYYQDELLDAEAPIKTIYVPGDDWDLASVAYGRFAWYVKKQIPSACDTNLTFWLGEEGEEFF